MCRERGGERGERGRETGEESEVFGRRSSFARWRTVSRITAGYLYRTREKYEEYEPLYTHWSWTRGGEQDRVPAGCFAFTDTYSVLVVPLPSRHCCISAVCLEQKTSINGNGSVAALDSSRNMD